MKERSFFVPTRNESSSCDKGTKHTETENKREKDKRERRGTQNHFFVQIFFAALSENNYISSKLYLFIKRTAHHHTGVLLRDINKHTHIT